MKELKYLKGDINRANEEKNLIEESIKNDSRTVFVLTGDVSLRKYISYLHDEIGLKNSIIHRFKICKQVKFGNDVTYIDCNKNSFHPQNMGELIKCLSPDEKEELVVESNSRELLAEIMQQLVYIDYPITNLRVQLRKEYEDAEKTERFMHRVDDLNDAVGRAEESLRNITIDEGSENADELRDILKDTIDTFSGIKSRVDKARNIEMKIAAVASKKTGKSVIVNSMIGKELAPTSLELATPNTCIYKKSQDNKYYLTYNNKRSDFASDNEIRKTIGEEFKKAESGGTSKSGHLLENMMIEYVAEGTNFESYTVYDTPGPDAAGTEHHKETERAINECDVAIFAFDYSKYLVTSEVEFLKQVKDVFDKKGKFHTLIFTVNKMDLALGDKGTKSRIGFIDLIRTRLKEIDPKYGECVIFATSALDYFRTLEIKDATKRYNQCLPLLENDLVSCLDSTLQEFYDDENEDMIDLLVQIQNEVSKLKNQLRFKTVTLEDIQYFSGMPQFLSYVSYIAKSKAREEILNNITGEISLQKMELQAKIDSIKNIESLMEASDEKINGIKAVLDTYSSDVENTLSKKITETDKNVVGSFREINALLDEYKRKHNNYNPDIGELLKVLIEDGFPFRLDNNLIKPVWSDVKIILNQKYRNAEKKGITDFDKIQITNKEILDCAQKQIKNFINENAQSISNKSKGIAEELELLLKYRNKRLKGASDKCQADLERFDISIILPISEGFSPSLSEPKVVINPISGGDLRSLKIEYNNKKVSLIRHIFRILRGKDEGENEIKVKHYSDKELNDIFDKSYKQYCDLMYGPNFALEKTMEININNLVDCIKEMIQNIEHEFNTLNSSYKSCVETFMNAIDNRETYLLEKEQLQNKKQLISDIKEATNEFMFVWGNILQGEEAKL